MTINDMARIIQAEAGLLSFAGKLAVAQCIIDNDYNANAFTKPADVASEECIEAAKRAVDGMRRFPNHKLLQFRSFTKYSDGNGNPDWNKIKSGICPIPDEYLYLGKDGEEPWGHFYFGLPNPSSEVSLKLTVVYDGNDGVNIRSTPKIKDNNIVGVIYKGGEYTVVGQSADKKFWLLKSGVYISSLPSLTCVYEGKRVNYTVRVKIEDLNIRKGHGTNYANYSEPISRGVYTIIEECKGNGSILGWGLLKSYSDDRDGWISLDYVERV